MAESQTFEELRDAYKQAISELKAAQKRIGELEPIERAHTFRQAGFDPDSREGRMIAKLLGDEPATVDAIRRTAEEFELRPPDTAATDDGGDAPRPVGERSPDAQARAEASQRIGDLRAVAQPVGAQRVGWDEFKQIQLHDPTRAFELMKAHKVDVPPHLQAALNHNALERQNQLVVTGGDA